MKLKLPLGQRVKHVAPVLAVLAGLGFAGLCQGNEPLLNPSIVIPPSSYVPQAASEESARGKKQFDKYNCTTCHSVNSEGGCIAPPFDGIGGRRKRSFILARITKDPIAIKEFAILYPQGELFEHPRIPAVHAREIAAYLLTLPDPSGGFKVTPHKVTGGVTVDVNQSVEPASQTRKPTASEIAKGREVFNQRGCIACHSIGNFGGHFAPRLDGISGRHDREYVSNRITAAEFYANNGGEYCERGTVMLPSGLTKDQIEKITTYLMSLPASR